MSSHPASDKLDLRALAQAGTPQQGQWPLQALPRLADEAVAPGQAPFVWTAQAEWRQPRVLTGMAQADAPVLWLHLTVSGDMALSCQRCLTPVVTPLVVDRWFRFVADEATAEAEDEDSEEDVLVFSPAFDLRALAEDELIMALPLVPMHDTCPTPVVMQAGAADAPEVPEKPHPFAALAQLKKKD